MDFSRKKTLIILDWDDTLFPTSWILENKIDLTDPTIRSKYYKDFKKLDKKIYKILSRLRRHGKVIIITNAMPEWIHLSSSVLAKSHDIVNKLKVISARKEYQGKTDMKNWKKMCFLNEMNNHIQKYNLNNIISMGDAEYEYHALVNLYKSQNNHYDKFLKSVQFIKNPELEKLLDQLKIVADKAEHICKYKNHLDLNFRHSE